MDFCRVIFAHFSVFTFRRFTFLGLRKNASTLKKNQKSHAGHVIKAPRSAPLINFHAFETTLRYQFVKLPENDSVKKSQEIHSSVFS